MVVKGHTGSLKISEQSNDVNKIVSKKECRFSEQEGQSSDGTYLTLG